MSQSPPNELMVEMVRAIVSRPDHVTVDQTTHETFDVLTVHVSSEDMGRVVGRGGSTWETLRKYFIVLSGFHQRKYLIELSEPE